MQRGQAGTASPRNSAQHFKNDSRRAKQRQSMKHVSNMERQLTASWAMLGANPERGGARRGAMGRAEGGNRAYHLDNRGALESVCLIPDSCISISCWAPIRSFQLCACKHQLVPRDWFQVAGRYAFEDFCLMLSGGLMSFSMEFRISSTCCNSNNTSSCGSSSSSPRDLGTTLSQWTNPKVSRRDFLNSPFFGEDLFQYLISFSSTPQWPAGPLGASEACAG